MRSLLKRNWERSILRRASVLLLMLLPGFALNYGLMLGASRLLDIDTFGIFYTAISIVNLFFMPAVVVGSFFVYEVAGASASGGADEARLAYERHLGLTAKWGLAPSLLLAAGFVVSSFLVSVTGWLLVIAVVVTVYSSYFVECLRSCLQGMQRFVRVGVIGFAWMGGRFILGLAGIYVLGTAWGGMAGVALASLLVFLCMHWFLSREWSRPASARGTGRPPDARLLAFLASYGVFPGIVYLDVLLAYFVLPGADLGAYSASSVLPKALVLIAAPIVQVMFPVLVAGREQAQSGVFGLSKGLLFTAAFTASAVAVLVFFQESVCGGAIGIRNCRGDLLLPLGSGAIALCLIRVLVLHKLAEAAYWQALLLFGAALAFLAVTLQSAHTPATLASNYAIFSWVSFTGYSLTNVRLAWLSTFVRALARPIRAGRG